jgi:hypothetical protein
MVAVRGNVSPCLMNLALWHEDVWGSGCMAPIIFTMALDGSSQLHDSGRSTARGKAPGAYWIGEGAGSRAGLDSVPWIELRPSSPHPVYTDILSWLSDVGHTLLNGRTKTMHVGLILRNERGRRKPAHGSGYSDWLRARRPRGRSSSSSSDIARPTVGSIQPI